MESKFDDIRPYRDDEIPAAVERIIAHPYLPCIVKYLRISDSVSVPDILTACRCVDDFQSKIMSFVVDRIIKNTTAGVSYDGLGYFEGDKKHVIVTNHRDIALDAAIIQLIFYNHKINTTELAIGDNLISSKFAEDVARSNKMIKVVRSTSPRQMYESSKLLSEYIREAVTTGRSSVWIAQRQGRTKDGKDITEQGLLKMLDMSGSGDFTADTKALEILPVAISYEFEPCDAQKTQEIYISRRQKYVKGEDEDFNSILTGISQWKGRVHLEFTEPILPEEVDYCAQFSHNERFKELAKIIDKQIHLTYKLWPNNYVAADLINESSGVPLSYESRYTSEEKERFTEHLMRQLSTIEGDRNELRDIFLRIYANPLFSKEKVQG